MTKDHIVTAKTETGEEIEVLPPTTLELANEFIKTYKGKKHKKLQAVKIYVKPKYSDIA